MNAPTMLIMVTSKLSVHNVENATANKCGYVWFLDLKRPIKGEIAYGNDS